MPFFPSNRNFSKGYADGIGIGRYALPPTAVAQRGFRKAGQDGTPVAERKPSDRRAIPAKTPTPDAVTIAANPGATLAPATPAPRMRFLRIRGDSDGGGCA
jgi:hypothetical protein